MVAEDAPSIIEGVFRITDTLQWYTPIFQTCELSTEYILLTLLNDVQTNLGAPYNILLNLIRNQFNLLSDAVVLVADIFYEDSFSMTFWIGDIFYNLVVMDPLEYDVTKLFPQNDFVD